MKIFAIFKSLLIKCICKIRFGNRIKIAWINSVKGKLNISIASNGAIDIGKYMMINGPLYLRASDNANITIGDDVFFNHNCSITAKEKIIIGSNTLIANNVVIVDHDHCFSNEGISEDYNIKSISIGENVWIGANCVILKGTVIGNNSVIAAGSVVNCTIPENELWGGVPAKCLKKIV